MQALNTLDHIICHVAKKESEPLLEASHQHSSYMKRQKHGHRETMLRKIAQDTTKNYGESCQRKKKRRKKTWAKELLGNTSGPKLKKRKEV